MRLSNFSLGINSHPGEAPDSREITARSVLNLRPNRDGYLTPATWFLDHYEFVSPVTGIAEANDTLFFLLSNGDLQKMDHDEPAPVSLIQASPMEGRLSIIDDFEDYVLITSESLSDPGYFYSIEDEAIYPLALNRASRPDNPHGRFDSNNFNEGFGSYSIQYLFVEILEDHAINALGDAASDFSHSGVHFSVNTRDHEGFGSFSLFFDSFVFNNVDTTAIEIYRRYQFFPGTYNNENLYRAYFNYEDGEFIPISGSTGLVPVEDMQLSDFVKIATIDRDDKDSQWEDPAGKLTATSPTIDQLNIMSHTGIPGAKAWVLFNNYTFLANNQNLRFSHINYGNINPNNFPPENQINIQGNVDFVEVLQNTLLFGDRNNMWTLRGYDPYNFQIYRISSIGPVDSYSHTLTQEGQIAFLGHDGFYLTDGQTVQKISSPQLDYYFENRGISTGNVQIVPNGDIIWSVIFSNEDRETFLMTEIQDTPVFTQLSRHLGQSTRFKEDVEHVPLVKNNDFFEYHDDAGNPEWITYYERSALDERVFATEDQKRTVTDYLWDDYNNAYARPDSWSWESNQLMQASERAKVFERIEIAGHSDRVIDVEAEIDQNGTLGNWGQQDILLSPNMRAKRVPIKRRGNSISFTITSDGDVQLREIALVAREVGRI